MSGEVDWLVGSNPTCTVMDRRNFLKLVGAAVLCPKLPAQIPTTEVQSKRVTYITATETRYPETATIRLYGITARGKCIPLGAPILAERT